MMIKFNKTFPLFLALVLVSPGKIVSTNLSDKTPASLLPEDTLLYFEVSPAKYSIEKVKKLFFSIMEEKRAAKELETFGEIFQDEFGFNLLSRDDLNNNGFSEEEPIGICVNYRPRKENTQTVYQKKTTWIFPANRPEISYEFFKNNLEKKSGENFRYYEVKKNELLRFYQDNFGYYILKFQNFIFYSNDDLLISMLKKSPKKLSDNPDFVMFKNYLKGQAHNEELFYFFINSERSSAPLRDNPRLLLDNVFMDSVFIKELAHNAEYIGGYSLSNDKEFSVSVKYFFKPDYLDNEESFLGSLFKYKRKNIYTDKISALPLLYGKWQSNFSSAAENKETLTGVKNLKTFFGNITGDKDIVIPDGLDHFVDDNISLYVSELPPFHMINHFYLWKGYLTFTYNPKYLRSFKKFMSSLQDKGRNGKGYSIDYKKDHGYEVWEIQVKKLAKRYDKKKDEVIEEEKIYPVLIYLNNGIITITDNQNFIKSPPKVSFSSIEARTGHYRGKNSPVIFAYLNMKLVLDYFNKSSLALPVKNYLNFFENIKSSVFRLWREDNIISKEIILKLDR